MTTQFLVVLVIAVVLGVALGYFLGSRQGSTARAALSAERDLWRSRSEEVERAQQDDMEVALALAPLASGVARMERHVERLERERVQQLTRLEGHLEQVRRSGEHLERQTGSLATVLAASTARGSWGELQLQRVLELGGLADRVDVSFQSTIATDEGGTIRPDAVIRLPQGKNIVIDAKAPVISASGDTPDDTAVNHAKHAKALRRHVESLATKSYWSALPACPEFVVCFVPGEGLLATACDADPTLLDFALGKKVVLTSPTSLVALLRTVALTWQHESLTVEAHRLLEVGKQLHERVITLVRQTDKLGKSLQRSVQDYNAVVGCLESRVLVTTRRLTHLENHADLTQPPAIDLVPRAFSSPETLESLEDTR